MFRSASARRPAAATRDPGGARGDCFRKMLAPRALDLARPFLTDEAEIVEALLDVIGEPESLTCVAVGDRTLAYRTTALRRMAGYVSVDPELLPRSAEGAHPRMSTLRLRIEDATAEQLPRGRRLWLFHFNVFAYLDEHASWLPKLVRPDDILLISIWSRRAADAGVRERYFAHLDAVCESQCARPHGTVRSRVMNRTLELDLPFRHATELFEQSVADVFVVSVGEPLAHRSTP